MVGVITYSTGISGDLVICTLLKKMLSTVVPRKSDSDVIFCLQCYQGLIIDRSLVC